MPVKQVLIVACKDHWEQCSFLLDSIDFYLQGYKIVVVDNTPEWADLSYKLTNNHIRILPWQDFIPRRIVTESETSNYDRGWVSQQLIKLSAHKIFQDDYVCLDTSNVILASFENANWPVDRWATVPDRKHDFYDFYSQVVRMFNIPCLPVIQAQTPYILNSNRVKELLTFWTSWDTFEQWFCSFNRPSEFWLYDLWLQKSGGSLHVNGPHYVQAPLLCFYHKNNWESIKNKETDPRYFTVADVKRFLWEDPEFASVIKEKGLNFLNP